MSHRTASREPVGLDRRRRRSQPPPEVMAELSELHARLASAWPRHIGFPAGADMDWSPLLPYTQRLINNVGSPYDPPAWDIQTRAMEREVLDRLGELFRAPTQTAGYIASGATEGTLWALYQARQRHPDMIVYHSSAAHYSVPKCARVLDVPTTVVRADDTGQMDYADIRRRLRSHADRPALVVATVGTTRPEAVDDVRRIGAVLDTLPHQARWVHVDAALAGVPLALLPATGRPGMDFADHGAVRSLVVSGHKFFGTSMPCAPVLALDTTDGEHVPYVASHDNTITGSRDGHAALQLWWSLHTLGLDGWRHRAQRSRDLAAYTLSRLDEFGWTAFRSHPLAFTVTLKTPPEAVARRWQLPSEDGWSHVICMPGVTRRMVDRFLADVARSAGLRPSGIPRRDRPTSRRAAAARRARRSRSDGGTSNAAA